MLERCESKNGHRLQSMQAIATHPGILISTLRTGHRQRSLYTQQDNHTHGVFQGQSHQTLVWRTRGLADAEGPDVEAYGCGCTTLLSWFQLIKQFGGMLAQHLHSLDPPKQQTSEPLTRGAAGDSWEYSSATSNRLSRAGALCLQELRLICPRDLYPLTASSRVHRPIGPLQR